MPVLRAEGFDTDSLFDNKGGVRAVMLGLDPARESTLVDILTKRWAQRSRRNVLPTASRIASRSTAC